MTIRTVNTQPIDLRTRASVDAAGVTDIGLVRERNEDQFLVATVERGLRVRGCSVPEIGSRLGDEATLLVVADGMGGHEGGDLASALAIRTVVDQMSLVSTVRDLRPRHADSLPGVRRGLMSAVARGDDEVRRAASHGAGAKGMGTTLTIAYLSYPKLYVAHIGDSRCYLFRDGAIYQLTSDHTLAEELRTRLDNEIAEDSRFHHVLTKAVGGSGVEAATPEVRRLNLLAADTVFLCTDGVTKHLSDDDLVQLLGRSEGAAEVSQLIVDEANRRGGRDNITAVVARCPEAA